MRREEVDKFLAEYEEDSDKDETSTPSVDKELDAVSGEKSEPATHIYRCKDEAIKTVDEKRSLTFLAPEITRVLTFLKSNNKLRKQQLHE